MCVAKKNTFVKFYAVFAYYLSLNYVFLKLIYIFIKSEVNQ